MEEDNMQKTAFRAESSHLYEFTHMPWLIKCRLWLLSSYGAMSRRQTVCHLVAIPRWFLYFSLNIEEMLDCIELVFNRLKEFSLKIKPKNVISLIPVFIPESYVIIRRNICKPWESGKVWDWQISTNAKKYIPYWDIAFYYQRFIPKFATIVQCLHELVGPTSNKHKKLEVRREENQLHLLKWLKWRV